MFSIFQTTVASLYQSYPETGPTHQDYCWNSWLPTATGFSKTWRQDQGSFRFCLLLTRYSQPPRIATGLHHIHYRFTSRTALVGAWSQWRSVRLYGNKIRNEISSVRFSFNLLLKQRWTISSSVHSMWILQVWKHVISLKYCIAYLAGGEIGICKWTPPTFG